MAYQTTHLNKKTGVTYVYEVVSSWDKDKKQSRNTQICIGKIKPKTKEFIPSKRLKPEQAAVRDPHVVANAEVLGPSLILDEIGKRIGLDNILQTCFADNYAQIRSMVYYLVARGEALCYCAKWSAQNGHSASNLSSQRISEILESITMAKKQQFFANWLQHVSADDYFCYDITSVSSYSELNQYVKYGYNRDKEKLPQINIALLTAQKTGLPVYYQDLPGNITDVTTLHNLIESFKALNVDSLCYVMDKGFYSQSNIDDLYASKNKFITSVPLSNAWLQKQIDNIYAHADDINYYHAIDNEALYVHSEIYKWGDKQHRCYVHLFYNPYIKANAVTKFHQQLLEYKNEVESGKSTVDHQNFYDKYLIIKKTPKRGTQVSFNTDAVNEYVRRYAGFQAIISNFVKDPISALQTYRDKDVVEKCFDDLKNLLDSKRLRMHSSEVSKGRLFIQFIALIYINALRKEMRESGLIKKYTFREIFMEMESCVKITYRGKYKPIITEVTKAQREIFSALNIVIAKT